MKNILYETKKKKGLLVIPLPKTLIRRKIARK